MTQRRTLGESPLDLLIPKASTGKKPAAKKQQKEKEKEPRQAAGKQAARSSGRHEKEPAAAETKTERVAAKEEEKEQKRTTEEPPAGSAADVRRKAEPAPGQESPQAETRRTSEEPTVKAPPGQYLTFILGGEEYGTSILQIREVIEYESATRVPLMPRWIRGVMNLRGNVVPVVDLAVKFGLPPVPTTERTCVVITELEVEGRPSVMGVVVDEVRQVIDLVEDQLEPAPAFGTRIHLDYLLGMANLGERIVLLLHVDRILSTDELLLADSLQSEDEAATADEADGAEDAQARQERAESA